MTAGARRQDAGVSSSRDCSEPDVLHCSTHWVTSSDGGGCS